MHMTARLTLANLTDRTGLDLLAHLEREITVPVTGGLQAQGDLIVIPLSELGNVTIDPHATWRLVPVTGIELLRSSAGGNPHTLTADPGTCQWTTTVRDPAGLALGALTATEAVYLLHPEHGGTGIAPGTYIVRRQRELGSAPNRAAIQLIAD
jgi:hypothetical protein